MAFPRLSVCLSDCSGFFFVNCLSVYVYVLLSYVVVVCSPLCFGRLSYCLCSILFTVKCQMSFALCAVRFSTVCVVKESLFHNVLSSFKCLLSYSLSLLRNYHLISAVAVVTSRWFTQCFLPSVIVLYYCSGGACNPTPVALVTSCSG